MSVGDKFINLFIRGKDLLSGEAGKSSAALKELQKETRETSNELTELEKTQRGILEAQGLEIYAGAAKDALATARAAVENLATGMDQAERPTKAQAEALRAARQAASNAQREYDKVAASLRKTTSALEQAGVDTKDLTGEQKRLEQEAEDVTARLQDQRGRLKELRAGMNQAANSTKGFASGLSKTTKELIGLGAAYLSIDALKDSFLGLLRSGAEFENYRAQLVGMYQDIEQGEQAYQWIKDFTRETPLTLDQTTEAFRQLKNAGMDPMDGTMRKLVQANSQFGDGQESLINIARQLGRAYGDSKLQLEDLNAITDNGVPAVKLLAEAMGISAAEVRELSSQGKLGREQVKLLLDEMDRVSDGAIERGMNTLNGLWAEARSRFDEFVDSISQAGVLDYFKGMLRDFNAELTRMAASGELQKLAEQVSNFITGTAERIKEFVTTGTGGLDGLIDKIQVTTATARLLFNGFTAGVKTIGATFALATNTILRGVAAMAAGIGKTEFAEKMRVNADAALAVADAFVKETEQDAKDVAAAWDDIVGDSLNNTTAKLKQVGQQQQDTANTTKTLTEKVSELGNQSEQTAAKLEDVAEKGSKSTESIESAWRKLGLDYKEISGQMTVSGAEVVKSFKEIAQSGEANFDRIRKAVEASVDQASTKAELEAIAEAYKKWAEDHGVSADKIQTDLELIGEKASGLSDAYGVLGIESSAALAKTAAAQREALDELKKSKAPLEEIKAGFLEYAETAIQAAEAAGKPVDPMLASQAAALGLAEELAKLQVQYGQTGGAAKTAGDDIKAGGDSISQAGDQAGYTKEAMAALAESTDRAAAAGEGAGGVAAYLTGYLQALGKKAAELSQQTALYMSQLLGTASASASATTEAERLSAALDENAAAYRRIRDYVATNPLADLQKQIGLAYLTAERAYLNQAEAASRLQEKLEDTSSASINVLRAAERATRQFDYLDDQDLSGLQAAIDATRSKINALRDDAAATVNSLKDELDSIYGNAADIEERRYQEQIRALGGKLEQAQILRDNESIAYYQEAIKLARQLHKEKLDAINAEAKAEKASSSSSSSSSSSRDTGSASASSSNARPNTTTTVTEKVVTLRLQGPTGQIADLQATSDSVVQEVLSILEQAGMRVA